MLLLAGLAFVTLAAPASASVLYEADASSPFAEEWVSGNAYDVKSGEGTVGSDSGFTSTTRITRVTTPAPPSPFTYAWKTTVANGDADYYDTEHEPGQKNQRTEMGMGNPTRTMPDGVDREMREGDVRFIAYNLYIPKEFSSGEWAALNQNKGNGASGNGPLGLYIWNGKLDLRKSTSQETTSTSMTSKYLTPTAVPRDTWIKILIEVKWSTNPANGYYALYANLGDGLGFRTLLAKTTDWTLKNNITVHPRLGIYRSKVTAEDGSDSVYWAGFNVATTRPDATQFAFGESAPLLKNTGLPVASPATPKQGVSEAATTGTWTGEPTSYVYQWERCEGTCTEWKKIGTATKSTYTPVEGDVGYKLRVKVTAKNAGGEEASATSAATNQVLPDGQITEYELPSGSYPRGIAAGPDGNLWFVADETNKVGKITTSGKITEYSLPEKSHPTGITAGPDGNLWVTELSTSKIAKVTTSGTITEYSLPVSSGPTAITAGPDGNLWYATCYSKKIGKITTSGTITEYLPAANTCLESITAGPDGNLWFTGSSKSKIGKITTSGAVTEYSLPELSYPHAITSGPDGNLWYTTFQGKVGKITTAGVRTEYTLPVGAGPEQIVKGADGNLWFTDSYRRKIGRMTTSGSLTEYALTGSPSPSGITSGPDQKIWFTRDLYGGSGNTVGNIAP